MGPWLRPGHPVWSHPGWALDVGGQLAGLNSHLCLAQLSGAFLALRICSPTCSLVLP